MYYIIFVINLYLCLLCDISSALPSGKETLIIGGQDVTDQVSSAVALYYDNDYLCTSTVISPTTILTAGHCVVEDGQALPTNLFHGIANIDRTAPQVRIEFSDIIPHPNYSLETVDNDIAIMKTTQPIPITGDSNVRAICLAGRDYVPNNDSAIAFGWGFTSNIRRTIPEILQYVEQVLISNSECSQENIWVNENKMCAEGTSRRSGICNGDSGGPLVSAANPSIQMGINSYGNVRLGCGRTSAVFTRISEYVDYIIRAANDTVCFSPPM